MTSWKPAVHPINNNLVLVFIIFMSVVVPTAITWLVIYCKEFKAWIEHKNDKDDKKE